TVPAPLLGLRSACRSADPDAHFLHRFECSSHHPHPHSFPTRRSSDLLHQPTHHPKPVTDRRLLEEPDPLLARPALEHRVHHRRQIGKSTRLNSSHVKISYAVFCLKKKKKTRIQPESRATTTRRTNSES